MRNFYAFDCDNNNNIKLGLGVPRYVELGSDVGSC